MKPTLSFASLVLVAAFSSAGSAALAQEEPPKLEPLPELPEGKAVVEEDLEGAVRIRKQRGDKIEVAKRGGHVVAIKVTPAQGAPYYLVDRAGNGKFAIYDGPISGLVFPSWTVLTW